MATGISQASTSTAQLAYLEETAFGVVETGAPKALRMTGEDLKFDFTLDSSKEINASGQITDAITTDAAATGGFQFEMQYHEYDPFITSLLRSTFNDFGTGGVKTLTLSFNDGTGVITGTAADFSELVVGQYFSVKDSVGNDGHYRIGARAENGSTITVDTETPLLADETSTASVKISATRVGIGTDTLRSFSIEKVFGDVGQYFMHRGRAISKMDFSFTAGSIMTGSFGTVGKDAVRADNTQFSAPAEAAEAFGVISGVVGLGNLIVEDAGGTSILGGAYIKSGNISIDGKLREQKAVGYLGSIGIGKSQFMVSGTLEIYLVTGSIYDAALAGQPITIAIPVKDVDGNGYAFIFENTKLKPPTVAAGGLDQDVMLSVEFTATAPDTTTDSMIWIDRFGDTVTYET